MKRMLVGLLSLMSATASAGTLASQTPQFTKVMTIVFENVDYSKAVQQPYFKELISKGALMTNYRAIMHPSQPNYIALTAGDTYRVKTNDSVTLDVRHIGDLLEEKALTWKVYAEGYPSTPSCFTGKSKGQYMRKHNPFISYKNVQTDPRRCANIVDASVLDSDVAKGLPNYSFYIPDDNNNGHDTGVAFADKWLRRVFGPRFANSEFMRDMTVVLTFDEGAPGSQVYTLLLGGNVIPGSKVTTPLTHYSLLRTIEVGFGLGDLGRNDVAAQVITGVWK